MSFLNIYLEFYIFSPIILDLCVNGVCFLQSTGILFSDNQIFKDILPLKIFEQK